MKILIVARAWGYEGGIEQYLINLVKALHQFGHKSVIMYARKTDIPVKEQLPISAEYPIPSLDEFPDRYNIKDVEKVLKIVKEENIDIVYINEITNYAIIEALNTRKTTVAMLHGCQSTCLRHGVKTFYISRQICNHKIGVRCLLHGCFLSTHLKGKLWNKLNNIAKFQHRLEAYCKFKKLLVTSHYMKNELLKHGFKNGQITILPYPVESLELKEDSLNCDDNIVLFVGRIDRYKGVDVLLKTLGFVQNDFEAWIIGEGPSRKKYEHICKKLNLQDKVKFLGWIINDDLRNFYLKATLVVVPSIWPESFGIVGIEAMACGKPVVAFDVGGISEWLEHGETGFLVKRMNYRTLADKITLLLADKSLARKMGLNGRKRCLVKFNRANYIEKLMEIFQSAIENKKNKHKVN